MLIIVLAVFDEKPLRHWHFGVSVNMLVNVLTSLVSIALALPVASCIAQMRWLWLKGKETPYAEVKSFGAGPIDIVVMLWKHPTM